MADEQSPRPFRRERNLSNRNFRRHGSNRRFSAESHSSVDSYTTSNNNETEPNNNASNTPSAASALSASSSFLYSYSANTDTELAFKQTSLLKIEQGEELQLQRNDTMDVPPTPDPALMGFQQKLQRFETLKADERIIFKIGKFNSKQQTSGASNASPLRVLPTLGSSRPGTPTTPMSPPPMSPPPLPTSSPPPTPPKPRVSSLYKCVSESHSEDEVDELSSDSAPQADYELISEGQGSVGGLALTVDDFGEVKTVSCNNSGDEGSGGHEEDADTTEKPKKGTKDFPRNYRSTPRPKTEIIGTTNRNLIGKFNSLRHPKHSDEEEREDDEVELRDVSFKNIQPILDELITSEATYVESLFNGIKNYGNIFDRKDLPLGLRGKKYVLLGNIEQIAEFHRDEFLPMLVRNRRNLKLLFDEFQHFVEQNCFYGYVIFTMNKQKSLKLCDEFKNYFKELQVELNDKLGINSFLVQPIQRIAKYPLLLKEFISALFQNREIIMKPLIESCCRLDKKIRTLLTTTNESEVVNDIIDCHEFNVFFQGKFRKVSDFNVFDHTLKRSYRGKLFIFDKCIIYTEIKGKHLLFHGRYPCEHIGIVSKTKSFTLFYQRRKQQECDFSGEVALIELWMELIRDMVSTFATEERRKLQELYSRESDHMHRKPPSLSLFRDSNRFSSDSGIGNIWVMPKPEVGEDALSNRTTWYAVS